MEKTRKNTNRTNLKYIEMTSNQQKVCFIEKINSILSEKKGCIMRIPSTPVPKVTFWINSAENKVGFTITRTNFKVGWYVYNKKWYPASYMDGMVYEKDYSHEENEFNDEENEFFNKVLLDSCGKNDIVKELYK